MPFARLIVFVAALFALANASSTLPGVALVAQQASECWIDGGQVAVAKKAADDASGATYRFLPALAVEPVPLPAERTWFAAVAPRAFGPHKKHAYSRRFSGLSPPFLA